MRRGGFHDALENLRYFKYRTIADVRNASAKFVEPMDYLQRPLTPSRTNLNDSSTMPAPRSRTHSVL